MSAATPRAPARSWTVARHYLGMLGSGGGTWGVTLAALVPLLGSPNEARSASSAGENLLAPMFLLALLHWRGTGRAGGLDDALPLRRSRHDGVRVACGLAWAAAAMLVLVGLSVPAGLATHDLDFLVERALGMLPTVPMALGMYAVAAAVRLRSRRPLRALLVAFLLLGLLSAAPLALWVAVAAAAVWLLAPEDIRARAVRASSRGKEPAAPRPTARRPLAPRGWTGPRTAGTLRRPARLTAVFGRESRLALRRIALPLVFAAAWAWGRVSTDLDAVGAAGAASARFVLVLLCVVPFWVSRVERGAGREHADSLPVDTATLRALRVAAGATWLGAVLLAVATAAAAGGIASGGAASLPGVLLRTWAGAAGAALLVYLLAAVPVFLSARQPYMAGLMYGSVWVGVWRFTVDWVPQAAPLLPWSALAPLVGPPAPAAAWAPALALWLPLAVLAVPAAAAMGARREHPGWGRSARPARPALGVAAGGAA